ncbi:glycosyltransferase [Psychrobacillus sp. FJAT-21963]|uniref:glycosyltransferase n=1 Tax=Psychrobacillus sp. FJAT-21963 TaxID=1712028 RepID=UPI0006FC664F|nr:glycosyltransferase [Psychrobacillus sp. FJAT-21963]KQL33382.1 hypothetical protein AN959_17650 [Psychrobacillus sp. FJAT-21963]
MKRRILHILSTDGLAGAENVAMCIISNLSESYDFAYASPSGSIEKIVNSRNILYLPMNKLSIMQIRKVIKEWEPEIIHAHDFTATVKSLIAGFNIPVISHIHQHPMWLKSVNKYSILFFLACIKTKKIIVVTPAIKESTFLSSIFNKKSIILKNIVDTKLIEKQASKPTNKSYDIAFIGRFEDVKNPLGFIDVISQTVVELPNMKVVMMGEGSMEKECRELIREKGLGKNIELIGFMNNPYPILKNSKVLVMTSKSEGLPMVAIEALSLGKPIIVPKLEGLESVVDSSCGIICKEEREFVKGIISLLKSDEKYNEMALGASIKAHKIVNMEDYKNQLKMEYSSVT